ncbi:MAG: C40 family peptidase [Saprospiraceae bacterium]|nr:C40 family peptidase [Saprospiraceae bacterium]
MRSFLAIAVALIGTWCCNDSIHEEQSKLVLTEIENKRNTYAADKRTAIFDVFWDAKQQMLYGESNQPEGVDQLRRTIEDLEIPFVDSIHLLYGQPALVNLSVCNMRSHPKHSAELATQSLMGTRLNVYKKNGGWYLVQTPDGYLGWLDSGGLHLLSSADSLAWGQAQKVVVIEPYEFVFQINTEEILTDVVAGNILLLQRDLGLTLEVSLPDGRVGWIDANAVSGYQSFLRPHKPLLENILNVAHDFMGLPYLWGGTSPKAMDCSGFTKTVYYLNGLELPRDASQQVQVGQPVETDTTLINLEKGDFIFFGRKASTQHGEKITHVAIYLGEGKIIHASGRVQVESLRRGDANFNEYRLQTMVRAKRMHESLGEHGVIPLSEHPWY